jgi:glycosyltransferase involved in cell wall biosynthesis
MSASARKELPLSGRTIVCLATQEWDAHWSVAQQVASRLAPDNRVIYVEPFHPPLARLLKRHKLLQKQRDEHVPQIREVRPNLTVFRPEYPYTPGNMRSRLSGVINDRLYEAELRGTFRKLGIDRPIFWTFFAQSLSFLNLEHELFVYDCVDDWPSFFPNPIERQWVERIDLALTKKARLLFAGSDPLADKKRAVNSNSFVVNHAADVAHFSKASHAETVVPEELDRLSRPRIGFVGMIDTLRFDATLINEIANRADYQVVIVGGFMNGANTLIPDRPNIHRLGMKSVWQLPGYLKGMDICIMPYKINETTRYIFPLKLFEYLATGKPVVATPIPAVQRHASALYVAEGADFVSTVERALAEDTPERRSERQAYAQLRDWDAHVYRKAELTIRTLAATQPVEQARLN